MLTKTALIALLPAFYEAYHTPVHLLKKDFEIAYQPSNFIPLSPSFFTSIFEGKQMRQGKLTTFFCESELYTLFHYPHDEIAYVCIGPILYRRVNFDVNLKNISFFRNANAVGEPLNLLQMVTYLDDHNTGILKLIYQLLLDDIIDEDDIHNSYIEHRAYVRDDNIINQFSYNRREQVPIGNSHLDKWNILHYIKLGNPTLARVYASKIASKSISNLSEHSFSKDKYALVALITLITHAVRDVGVSIELAYTISDYHVHRLDECFSSQQVFSICNDAINDFCSLVKKNELNKYPRWIINCMDYVKEHLHTKITLEDISKHVHMSPSYVSVQYKKITGQSISQYCNAQRIIEAKYLLKNTTMTIQEIAMNLDYSTQSYFTKVFKAEANVLPNEYRKSE